MQRIRTSLRLTRRPKFAATDHALWSKTENLTSATQRILRAKPRCNICHCSMKLWINYRHSMAVFFTSRGDAARGLEVRERRLLYRPRKTVGLAPGFRQSIKVNETGL